MNNYSRGKKNTRREKIEQEAGIRKRGTIIGKEKKIEREGTIEKREKKIGKKSEKNNIRTRKIRNKCA